ncbi:MAG: DUF4173 domain-containing protein [Oscillospiraceae bacterium]|jgi:hypothetical protein|nr:DUF4173 domain-containing protein [Oscillospiraceae bacterium]
MDKRFDPQTGLPLNPILNQEEYIPPQVAEQPQAQQQPQQPQNPFFNGYINPAAPMAMPGCQPPYQPGFNPMPPYPQYPQKQKKQRQVFSLAEKIFAILFFALGYVFTKFVFNGTTGLTATVFFSLLAVLTLVFAISSQQKITAANIASFCIILLSASVFLFVPNNYIKTFNFMFLLVAYAIWVKSIGEGFNFAKKWVFYDALIAVFVTPFVNFAKIFPALFARSDAEKKSKSRARYVVLGLVLSVPILIVVIPLLIQADEMFAQIFNLRRLFSEFWNFIKYIIFGVPFACLFYSVISSKVRKTDADMIAQTARENLSVKTKVVPGAVSATALIPVLLVYALYFFVQLSYFVSAFSSILPEGFTTADYARRGFFELLFIAIINLSLVWAALVFSKRNNGKIGGGVKATTALMCMFTIILIITALSKMVFYMDSYGLTRLRIFTSVFMVFLGMLFFFLIIKIFANRFMFHLATVAVFFVLFFSLSMCNIDYCIARYNVDQYKADNISFMGFEMVEDLDESAVEPLLELYNDNSFRYRDELEAALQSRCDAIGNNKNSRTEFNFTTEKAEKLLAEAGFTPRLTNIEKSFNDAITELETNLEAQWGEVTFKQNTNMGFISTNYADWTITCDALGDAEVYLNLDGTYNNGNSFFDSADMFTLGYTNYFSSYEDKASDSINTNFISSILNYFAVDPETPEGLNKLLKEANELGKSGEYNFKDEYVDIVYYDVYSDSGNIYYNYYYDPMAKTNEQFVSFLSLSGDCIYNLK